MSEEGEINGGHEKKKEKRELNKHSRIFKHTCQQLRGIIALTW